MKVLGRDGNAILVDMEQTENGVRLGVVVRDEREVSPLLPLEQLDAGGLYDQEVKPGVRDRVLARVQAAQPELGVVI